MFSYWPYLVVKTFWIDVIFRIEARVSLDDVKCTHYFLIFLRVWSLKRENHSRVLIILKNLISFRSGKKTINSYLICRQELADNSSTSTEQSWFNKLKSNSHVAKFCPSISIFYIAKGTLFMCTRKNEIKRLWIWVATSCLVNYSWVAFAQEYMFHRISVKNQAENFILMESFRTQWNICWQ